MRTVKIGKRTIGEGHPLYFVADIAANHDGDLNRAYKLIELAKEAGADAAKFQNFKASKIVSREGFESLGGQLSHQKNWKKSVYEVYEDASISYDWTALLKKKCDEVGIDYFTSPYDFESVDKVDPYVDVYKVGSGDVSWPEIITYIAKKGKPVLIATGASSLQDVTRAMETLTKETKDIVLMQCNTNYTASLENFKYINLNVLKKFRELYPDIILGLSDHTPGHATVVGACALGARVFEKHFTDSNDREGPDHKFAMNPKTWREMVDRTNEVYIAMGDGVKRIEDNEKDACVVQRRSLRVVRDLAPGHILSASDLEALRPIPADGIPPYELNNVVGKKLASAITKGQHLTFKHLG
ncbi:MAG: N-acetylneuraminate synthase family protein [Bacteroidota bacterium]